MPSHTTRSEKLDLRLTRHAKRALQAAAAVAHRSVSEFVLESALARAEEALPTGGRLVLTRHSGKHSWRRLTPLLAPCPILSGF
jgi:uncharacterized protein (DUF1778 family)